MKAWIARNRIDVALVALAFILLAPIVSADSAQPASRLALTASVVEHHTVDIKGYPIGVDRALYEGKLRSDKPPGQPLFAVPAYVVSRVLGTQSAQHLRMRGNLGLWFVTLWSSLLPFLALLVLMRRAAARFAPRASLVVACALGFGSLLLPYSVNLFGHALAAALAFGAWLVLERDRTSIRRLLLSGLLVGSAVAVEYEVGIIAIVLLVVAAIAARRRVGYLIAGAVPPALVVGVYQGRAFGAPWHLPFGYFAGTINGTSEGGYTIPGLHGVALAVTGGRGLLLLSPVVLVGLLAAVFAVGSTRATARMHAVVALGVAVPYLLLVAGWSGTPTLETPGPRFLVPLVPFLAAPLAAVWARLRVLTIVTAAWGAAVQLTAATTMLFIAQGTPLLSEDWHRIRTHAFAPTAWSMTLGRAGVALYALTVAIAVTWLWRVASRHDRGPAWVTRREAAAV